ncbi:helix-turn-helix transcriptional regulator [Methylobacterium sp. WL7]|uniref:helix-turn-helix domain-containing protein n=1 Tax=Methylobacterium sp. WL7 TaxID=2603900 RepID=UPI0011C94898|nr:helix-turn-helix transcriptional regulator [Methylobacterium sp. WL7]TXN36649.1 helix-turn-helix transcriptional regulator [Methylobacterium sp. WL7]
MRARALVAWNLRRLRVEKNLTQEALGLLAEREPSYIGRIERGRENTTVDTLEALAAVLDAPVSAFFVVPEPDVAAPAPLRAGRKPSSASKGARTS